MAVDGTGNPTSVSSLAPVRRIRWSNPFVVLGLMIAGFFAVSLYGGIVAYYNLSIDAAHAYDLGIFQQAFSSTVQGYHVPFYESVDCIVKGRCSFLIVHPSFILYPLTPIYGVAPSPITLFAERSLVVGLAALPLYWMTRQVTHSEGKALLAAGLYLLWAPILSGDLYSFHVESFIPLELFTMIALWQAGRYRLGLLMAGLSFVTLEVAPVFVFFIGVFFLVPEIEEALRAGGRRWKSGRGSPGRWMATMRGLGGSVRASLRRVDVRYTTALIVVSVLGYIAVNLFLNEFGAGLLGLPRPPEPGGLEGLFYNNSQNGTTGNLGALAKSPALMISIEYWLILYALVGFLPLLNPRSFVVVGLPWIGYSLLNDVHRFSTLSSQYTMLAAIPVFLGLAYGLARVDFHRKIWPVRAPKPSPAPEASASPTIRPRRRRRVTATWAVVFGVIIAANLLINPMMPLIPDTLGTPHGVFGPYYFEPWITVQPGFAWVERLVALIAPHEPVAVTLDLFPLVANNLDAYLLAPIPPNVTGMPFNLSAGPDWVLVTPSAVGGGGEPLRDQLPNESIYQLRGYAATSTVGPILLYERGYVGSPELFGPQASLPSVTWTPSQGLTVARVGMQIENSSAPGGVAIQTNESSGKAGEVCTAKTGFLPPGSYSLTADLARFPSGHNVSGTTRILEIRLLEFGGLLWETNVTAAQLPLSGWTSLEFNFTALDPVVNPEIEIYSESLDAPFAIASLALDPNG
ncbi:MAG: DUF2079 domain-containing protein [Thermoplasmata archaeon]